MPQPLGYSFAPTFDNAREGQGQPADQAQRAIQTLSFQLPRFVGAGRNKLSPLQGQQMAGSPMSQAVLESVLRTILGPSATMGMFDGGSSDPAGVHGAGELSPQLLQGLIGGGGRTPAPTIHPGDEGRIPFGGPSLDGDMGVMPGFGRDKSDWGSWVPGERSMGAERVGHVMPDFSRGSGYY